ncbi:MAG: M1 family metallopeptidase, partial [Cytophagales bacterium]|nr:M1 family metallopeptidase [Cytophagales bacterium]
MRNNLLQSVGLVLLFIFFHACKSSPPAASDTSKESVTDSVVAAVADLADTLAPPAPPPPPLPYQPERTRRHDLLHTKLDVRFDWAAQHLLGTATLTLKPYFYAQDSLHLDAKGFDIKSVDFIDETFKLPLRYHYDSRVIAIKLPRTFTRNEPFSVRIRYVAKPNDLPKGGSAAITEDKGLYFINPDGKDPDKPRQIWTQGETEASSCWFPTIDSPNERCTQEISMTVDKQYVTLSNGKLISSKANPDGTRTDYWRQDKPHAPYLFMMAVGDFAVVKDKWNNLELSYLVEKPYAKYAKDIFGRTPEMLSFFSKILDYPYPWDKYAQVAVRDYVSGAMENTGAVVFGEYVQKDARELVDETSDDVIAHEMFHHWFGDLVTCESWANLPLNEAFATYSEYLWMEHKHGRDEADYHLLNDWEQYFAEAEEKQEPLIRYYHADKEDMFDAHSYQKGGAVLHMLRQQVGDEAFFRSLNLYLKRHAYNKAEIHDLRQAFEETTGEDMNWFFDQWFLTAGHPVLDVAHRYENGRVLLTVSQRPSDETAQILYRLPVQVDVWTGGRKTTHRITVNTYEQTFELPAAAQPDLVLFDAETHLLAKVTHPKTEAELVYQYRRSDKFLARYKAFNELFGVVKQAQYEAATDTIEATDTPLAERSADVQQVAKEALADKSWVIRQMAVRNLPGDDLGEYEATLEKMAANDPRSYVRAEALSQLIAAGPEAHQDVMRRALADTSYYVVSTALIGYLRTNPPDADRQLAAFRNYKNNDVTLAVAAYYANTAPADQFDWFTGQ